MNRAASNDSIWWLNPFWILVPPMIVASWVAWLIPDADYQLYWRMPKIFTTEDMMSCFWVAIACAAGSLVALWLDRALCRPGLAGGAATTIAPSWKGLRLVFYAAMAATVFAYALWFGLILKQAGVGIFIGVLRGDEGSIYELIRLRKDAAITGVTSFTQAGIAAGLAGVFLGVRAGWASVRWPLALLLGLTMMRAVFLAERLALIELMLPCVVLWLRLRGLGSFGGLTRRVVQIAPVAGALGLYVLFTFGEYFRSWGYYSEQGESSLLWFTLVRLSGYYVTSLNNGALLWQEMGALYFPNATLGWLWRFPMIGGHLRLFLGGNDEDIDTMKLIVSEDANAEFNNPTGIFVVMMDYGLPGALIFFVAFGCAVMLLYRAFQRGSVAGLFLYPFVFMGLTDQIRTFYLGGGRTFVAWVFLFAMVLATRREILRSMAAAPRRNDVPA